jgi:type I restriction enzyme, R subunit
VRNNIESNSEILAWLRGERSLYIESEKRTRNITLINYADASKNAFHVTEEWQYTNGSHTNRADDVFLINGIPIAVVESRSAKKHNAMEEALIQSRRYHKETPEMVTMPQVFDFTQILEFFYGVTWSLDRKNIFPWKHLDKANYEAKVKSFFAPLHLGYPEAPTGLRHSGLPDSRCPQPMNL